MSDKDLLRMIFSLVALTGSLPAYVSPAHNSVPANRMYDGS